MDVIIDVYDLPIRVFSALLVHVGYTFPDLDRYFETQYSAIAIKGQWNQWQYMFPDQNKHAEFILTWF